MKPLSRPDIDALADEIALAATRIDAAMHTLLTHIRRLDEAGGWARQGATSCATWLEWRIGLGPGTAREKVRVAKALGALPRIDEALEHGVVSYSKVRALTRVATPDNESKLLPHSFTLVFENGLRLTVIDDTPQYESFSVHVDGQPSLYV